MCIVTKINCKTVIVLAKEGRKPYIILPGLLRSLRDARCVNYVLE